DLGAAKIVFSASRAGGESVAGGPYTITPDAKDAAESLSGNDDVTRITGEITNTKKAATLTAVDKTKVYGSDDPQLTTTDSGFLAADLGADKIVFKIGRASCRERVWSPDTVSAAAKDGATSLDGNHHVTYKTGTLAITKCA